MCLSVRACVFALEEWHLSVQVHDDCSFARTDGVTASALKFTARVSAALELRRDGMRASHDSPGARVCKTAAREGREGRHSSAQPQLHRRPPPTCRSARWGISFAARQGAWVKGHVWPLRLSCRGTFRQKNGGPRRGAGLAFVAVGGQQCNERDGMGQVAGKRSGQDRKGLDRRG